MTKLKPSFYDDYFEGRFRGESKLGISNKIVKAK